MLNNVSKLIWQFSTRLIKLLNSTSLDQVIRLIFLGPSPSFTGISERLVRSHPPRKRNAIIKMGQVDWPRVTLVSPSFDLRPGIVPPFAEKDSQYFFFPSALSSTLRNSRKIPGKIKEWKNHKIEIAPPLLRRSTRIVAESNRWDKLRLLKEWRLLQKWPKSFCSSWINDAYGHS